MRLYFAWIETRSGLPLRANADSSRPNDGVAHHPAPTRPDSEIMIEPTSDRRLGTVRTAVLVAAALMIVVALAAINQTGQDAPSPPAAIPAPTDAPTMTSAPAPTSAAASTPTTPEPAASFPPVEACGAGLPPDQAVAALAEAMVTSRRTPSSTDFLTACLGSVPIIFTDMPPACWYDCSPATRSFGSVRTHEEFTDNVTAVWVSVLPVTYNSEGTYLDVWESWILEPAGDGYRLSDFRIEEPTVQRIKAIETLTKYFRHIDRGEWGDAAAMLNDGATNPDERFDLRELAPASYSVEGIALALQRWCGTGCDTQSPTAAELVFDDSYVLRRGSREIEVFWYEGTYSIGGLPFPLEQ